MRFLARSIPSLWLDLQGQCRAGGLRLFIRNAVSGSINAQPLACSSRGGAGQEQALPIKEYSLYKVSSLTLAFESSFFLRQAKDLMQKQLDAFKIWIESSRDLLLLVMLLLLYGAVLFWDNSLLARESMLYQKIASFDVSLPEGKLSLGWLLGPFQQGSNSLLLAILSACYHVSGHSVVLIKWIYGLSQLASLALFIMLGTRLFNQEVTFIAASLLTGCIGTFLNAFHPSLSMMLLPVFLGLLWLFFDWFEVSFRSHSYARSLYTHFAAIGFLLTVSFGCLGLPGLLIPLAIFALTMAFTRRFECLLDIHYPWLIVPFGVGCSLIFLLQLSLGGLGSLPSFLWPVSLRLGSLAEMIAFSLPILPLFLPAFFSKSTLNRALLSYSKSTWLLLSSLLVSSLMVLLFPEVHHVMAALFWLLLGLWAGFYLNESFRNPLLAEHLEWSLDANTVISSALGLLLTLVALQLAIGPWRWILHAFGLALPLSVIALQWLRTRLISRDLITSFLAVLGSITLLLYCAWLPIGYPNAGKALITSWRPDANDIVVQWQKSPTPILAPYLKHPPSIIGQAKELEDILSHAQPSQRVFLAIPEEHYWKLSRPSQMLLRGKAWQWKKPLSLDTMVSMIQDETLDFNTLAEWWYWVECLPEARHK
jgi:hypothetical protein